MWKFLKQRFNKRANDADSNKSNDDSENMNYYSEKPKRPSRISTNNGPGLEDIGWLMHYNVSQLDMKRIVSRIFQRMTTITIVEIYFCSSL